MSDSFYTQDEAAITRALDVKVVAPPEELGRSLEDLYEIAHTADELCRGDYKRVSLSVRALSWNNAHRYMSGRPSIS